jgi:alkylation response protein AidB-like acyl-CoA dehydrogenase
VIAPPPDHPGRLVVRALLAAHPAPTGVELAAAGLVCPHWPRPWGLDADPETQLAIDDELAAAGIERPDNQIGTGWAGPTIVAGGTPEQQARFLPPLLSGEEIWCQLFSEPEAGSDLASLRTTAVRDGDDYVVTGQKIWTTWADRSDYGILLARTDPDVPKHKGISYFLFPMRQPGVDVRPIREMSGGHHFNEVFLDGARVPVANRVGAEGDGWRLAGVTLGNERVSLSTGGLCWGLGPTHDDFVALVRTHGPITDPAMRQRVADAWIHGELIRLIGERITAALAAGGQPGPEASVKKVLADEHGQRVTSVVKDLTGAGGMLADAGPLGTDVGEWHWAYLFARALTIGGGTGEVQRDILAQSVLGLPR